MICIFRVYENKILTNQKCPSHCRVEVKSLETAKQKTTHTHKVISERLPESSCLKRSDCLVSFWDVPNLLIQSFSKLWQESFNRRLSYCPCAWLKKSLIQKFQSFIYSNHPCYHFYIVFSYFPLKFLNHISLFISKKLMSLLIIYSDKSKCNSLQLLSCPVIGERKLCCQGPIFLSSRIGGN